MPEARVQTAEDRAQREWETFGPPPEPDDDDGWPGDLDLSLEDEFDVKCMIVPRPRRESGSVSSLCQLIWLGGSDLVLLTSLTDFII
jgi:hypothetical protein